MAIREQWSILEGWLNEYRPAEASGLANPASDAQILELQLAFNFQIPAPFLSSVAIHDGEDPAGTLVFGHSRWLLPVRYCLEYRQEYRKAAIEDGGFECRGALQAFGPVKPCSWSDLWCPVFFDNDLIYCLDLDPPEGGQLGQVFIYDLEDLSVTRISKSFEEFLARIVSAAMGKTEWPFRGRNPT